MFNKHRLIAMAIVLTLALFGTGASLGVSRFLDGAEEPSPNGGNPDSGEPAVQRANDNEVLEAVGRSIPGFGGYYVDRKDKTIVYVYMLNQADQPSAEQAARAVLGDRRVIREVKALKADYSMSDLTAWYKLLKQHLWAQVDEVTGSGLDEQFNRITIRLSDLNAEPKVASVLADLGIPREAILIQPARQWQALTEDDLQDEWRPVVGGVQIQTGGVNGQLCTTGFITERDNVLGIVINSHCTNNDDPSSIGRRR